MRELDYLPNSYNVSLVYLPNSRYLDFANSQIQSTWNSQLAKSLWRDPNLFASNFINI
jgi:hypothetical protein